MFEATGLSKRLNDRRGDICDDAVVQRVVKEFDPEIVFHLAAQSIVREGYRDPVRTYLTNVVGTASVLNACRFAPSLRGVIVVTSDKCYENREWVWPYREEDRLGGADPYSSSKACAEIVTAAFRRSYYERGDTPVGIATARAGNVIGGGDWARDRLVPDLARAAATRQPARIRNPDSVRPWQHVIEPLGGYLSLAAHLIADPSRYSGAWNFGPTPDSVQTVKAVVTKLAACWKGRLSWEEDAAPHPHEARRLLLDSSRAASDLGWNGVLSLDEALELTTAWYDAHDDDPHSLEELTRSQISHYLEIVSSSQTPSKALPPMWGMG